MTPSLAARRPFGGLARRPFGGLARRPFGRLARCLGTALLALAAAACGTSDEEVLQIGCPDVRILRDAAEVTHFRPGGGTDLTDVVSRARLADISGSCEVGDDGTLVTFLVDLIAERGPALRGDQDTYRYFVALIGPGRTPLAKEVFETTVTFPPNEPIAGSEEELEQWLPLPGEVNPADHQVLLGFQLARGQLDFNRDLVGAAGGRAAR